MQNEFEDEPTTEYVRPTDGTASNDTAAIEQAIVSPVPFPTLTPREREVALLLSGGAKNSEIADELTLSVKTIDTHRASILRKLKVRNNVELALLAAREGWIVP